MKPAQLWAIFKKARLYMFALSAIFSAAWTVFLSVFLSREWPEYGTPQRAIFLTLVVVGGMSAILLYLMIVVRFRLWLDGARVAFLLTFQLGSALLLSFNTSIFPCTRFVTTSTCKTVFFVIIVGSWSQSLLLVLYAGFLSLMACVPADPANSTKVKDANGHHYTPSVDSVDSRTGLLRSGSYRNQGSYRAGRPLSPNSQSPARSVYPHQEAQLAFDHRARAIGYSAARSPRPGTPSSVRSGYSSASASSSTFYGPFSVSSPGPYSAQLPPASPANSIRKLPPRPLPNPFSDPMSRSSSPMSVRSYGSSVSEAHGYGYGERKLSIPVNDPRFGSPFDAIRFPPPPPYARETSQQSQPQPQMPYPRMIPSPLLPDPYSKDQSPGFLSVPNTPFMVRDPVRPNVPSRSYAATPGAHSIHSSMGSLHGHGSDRGGGRSVPPLLLPQQQFHSAVSPPVTALLPLPSGMTPYTPSSPYSDTRREYFPGGFDGPMMHNPWHGGEYGYYPAPQEQRNPTPPNVPVDVTVDLHQWQTDVMGAAQRH
ncbi:hypothetical protein HGRIS_013164 [Hohenbuehelia grisea]|uniref:Uncharacterized protein n=1 Tax=Hohenbuehelia grisea TaxID=104357 RepID=A0ABR3IUM0_9AGAR